MANWHPENLPRENGEIVPMQTPEIVSASRSTDIPAFYAYWFFYRLKVGYSVWTNPFNGAKIYVSYKNTRFIVFWSKNPQPLLKHLDYLKERNIGCYIQYSLNDYEEEKLELKVPSIQYRINTFKQLVDKLGIGHVIWRFDPLMLTDEISIDRLLSKIERIGDQLKSYTEKLVFSYADISIYKKVKANLEKNKIAYHEWTEPLMVEFAKRLAELNKKWGYTLATCGERIDLSQYGIQRNHCIDYDHIVRLAHDDKILMDFIGATIHKIKYDLFGEPEPLPARAILLSGDRYATKDDGQREFCGCLRSKDIGEYNTCPHMCEYCYANTSKDEALNNWKRHIMNKESETIIGK
jgi:DNA repair photolyase